MPCKQLGLSLVRRHENHGGSFANWLRWATPKGIVLPTGLELAEIEKRRAVRNETRANEELKRANEQARRADEERKRADTLAALLKKHGIDPGA